MRKFEVIAAVCSGKGKQMFNHGEVVNENQVNNADKLVADGFLKEITEAAAPVADAEEQTIPHIVTEEDVANNPDEDLTVGEEIGIPVSEIEETTEVPATEDVAEQPSEITEEQPENTEKPAAKPKKNKK